MEGTEEALSFSSNSSEGEKISDTLKVYIWLNGKPASNSFQIEITSSINSYKRLKEQINFTGQLKKNVEQMRVFNEKGIEIDDADISSLHNKDVLYTSLNGEPFEKENVIETYDKIKVIKKKDNDEIYEAKNHLSNKVVAIKKKDLSKYQLDDIYSLSRDAQFLSSLRNKNIIKIYNYFTTTNALYIIMKEAKGGTLAEEISKDGFPEDKCKEYFKQLYNAIRYIHNKGIVHGGLKPGNIVFLDEKKTKLAIIDFKLSSLSHTEKALNANIKNTTAPYIAPEIILDVEDKRIPSVDIWNLGIILYEMKFGKVPFKGKNVDETFDLILNEPLNFPLKFKISEALFELLFGLLKRNIHERIDVNSPLFEQWFTVQNPKLVNMKEYVNSDKVHKSSLFSDSKRRNSLNKNVTAMKDPIPIRNSRRGKTQITTGKLNLGDNVPSYMQGTQSSQHKGKKTSMFKK